MAFDCCDSLVDLKFPPETNVVSGINEYKKRLHNPDYIEDVF